MRFFALFFAEAGYFDPDADRPVASITCSTPWGVYISCISDTCTPAYTLQGATDNPSTIAISVYMYGQYSFTSVYGWVNRGTIVVSRSPRGMVFDEPAGSCGTRFTWTHDIVVGSPRNHDNHSSKNSG